MTWLISKALMNSLCSQERVEEFSEGTSLAGELSAPLSGNPIPQAYCAPDKTTVFSRLSRFGMTFKPLTADRGEELLTLYRAAFPARTYPSPEKAQGLTESAAECGDTWRGWLAKYDPATSSWRTAQCSLLEDLTESSVIFPRSGMTRGGLLWELPTLERRTKETGSGLLPTPVSIDAGSGRFNTSQGSSNKRPTLALMARKNLWPTPCAGDYRGPNPNPGKSGQKVMPSSEHSLPTKVGDLLNPVWVELLMGWPKNWTRLGAEIGSMKPQEQVEESKAGWTDLKPSATVKCLSVQPQPGDSLPLEEAA